MLASHHDFRELPSNEKLVEYCEEANEYNAFIIKLAFYCVEPAEAIQLMEFLREYGEKYNLSIIGMADVGRPTRLVAPLWGSKLTYGCPSYPPSAPGQVLVRDMREFFNAPEEELASITSQNMYTAVSHYLLNAAYA